MFFSRDTALQLNFGSYYLFRIILVSDSFDLKLLLKIIYIALSQQENHAFHCYNLKKYGEK